MRVGDKTLTRATVDHWMHIVAIKDYELLPKHAAPAWVVSQPPAFTACVAHLKAMPQTPGTIVPPNQAGLKGQCLDKYRALREQVLGFLISSTALIQEGEQRGLVATPTEIKQRFERVKLSEFGGSQAAYKRYLAITGETNADQMFRARVKVFTKKIEASFLTAKGQTELQRDRALVRFEESFSTRWALKTSCHTGYVVPDCKQYEGSQAPRITI